jgi:hypothetical protein
MKTVFSLSKQRNKFLRSNLETIDEVEGLFVNTDKLLEHSEQRCKTLKKEYKHLCTKSDILTKVREFYVDDWYSTTSQMIDTLDSMKRLREMKTELCKFKEILRIKEEIQEDVEMDIEKTIQQCIIKRITYKHMCVKKQDRNHDAEILRQVFYHDRLQELKTLFVKIKQRYIYVKEKQILKRREEDKKRQEEDKKRQEEEEEELKFLKMSSSENSGGTYQFVVSKRDKRRSRKKR